MKSYFLAGLFSFCTTAHGANYTVVPIDCPGSNGHAMGINSSGQVVGYYNSTNGTRAFIWDSGNFTVLGSLVGTNSYAMSINDAGQVTGYSQGADGHFHAFSYDGSSLTDLADWGGSGSFATALNNQPIYGGFTLLGSRYIATLFDSTATQVGTLGGTNSFILALNDSGQAVGYSETASDSTHAFLWDNGRMVDLNRTIALKGWELNEAHGINARGIIVGAGVYQGFPRGFIFSTEGITPINAPDRRVKTTAWSINNAGQVVGSFSVRGASRGFLWDQGQFFELNAQIPGTNAWLITEPRAINDSGEIVGTGLYNGRVTPFLLQPDAPPITMPVGGAGHTGKTTGQHVPSGENIVAPMAPTNIHVTGIGPATNTISWDLVDNATTYEIKAITDSWSWSVGVTSDSQIEDDWAWSGGPLTYQVTAINDAGSASASIDMPVISISNPPFYGDFPSGSTVPVSFSATSTSGIQKLIFSTGSMMITNTTNEVDTNIAPVPGTYAMTFQAVDGLGNSRFSGPRLIYCRPPITGTPRPYTLTFLEDKYAVSINNSGSVLLWGGTIWTTNGTTALPGANFNNSEAYCITEDGIVLGNYWDSISGLVGWTLSGADYTILPSGFSPMYAWLNGTVVGNSGSAIHAITNGVEFILPSPPSANSAQVNAISYNGAVVGMAYSDRDFPIAFRDVFSQESTLPAAPSDRTFFDAFGVNNAFDILVGAGDANYSQRAYIVRGTNLIEIGDGFPSPWFTGINNPGQIAFMSGLDEKGGTGLYIYDNGEIAPITILSDQPMWLDGISPFHMNDSGWIIASGGTDSAYGAVVLRPWQPGLSSIIVSISFLPTNSLVGQPIQIPLTVQDSVAITNVTLYVNGWALASTTNAATSLSFTPGNAGDYQIWVTATDVLGEMATSATNQITVLAQTAPTAPIAPAISPDGGIYNNDITVTVAATNNAGLKLMQSNLNLLNASAWSNGAYGDQPGFSAFGSTNLIATGLSPTGKTNLLWEAQGYYGGWNSEPVAIDPTKAYRFSVWLRSSGPTNGTCFFGPGGDSNAVASLDGYSSFFWSGTIPQNQWCLVMGYVHPTGETSTNSYGSVYDLSGNAIASCADFKWIPSATTSQHQIRLVSNDARVQQFFWDPHIEEVDSYTNAVWIYWTHMLDSPASIPLSGNHGTVITAVSYMAGNTNSASAIVTNQYTFQVASPTVTYGGTNQLFATTATLGATAYFSTDQTDPTTDSNPFIGPIPAGFGATPWLTNSPGTGAQLWKAFRDNYLPSPTFNSDIDGDGLQDSWEMHYFGNLDQGANDDSDGDGLTNFQEQYLGTSPIQADTNGNGISDADEDADNDLLTNIAELNWFHSDPLDRYYLATHPEDSGALASSPNRGTQTRQTQSSQGELDTCNTPTDGQFVTSTFSSWELHAFDRTIELTLPNGDPSKSYDIYISRPLGTDLPCIGVNVELYYHGQVGQTDFVFPIPPGSMGIFTAGTADDQDGDGIPDGFQILMMHQVFPNPHIIPQWRSNDSDNDGWSNYQEYLNGTNPEVPEIPALRVKIANPADGANYP